MKSKVFIVLMLAFAASSLSAQSGKWYIGGTAGFSSHKDKAGSVEFKSSSWNFSPEIGTWASDMIQVGLGLNISGYNQDGDAEDRTSYGGTIYARNWWNAGKPFRPFVGLNVPVSPDKYNDFQGIEHKVLSTGAYLNGGFGYALSDRVTVLGQLGWLGFTSTTDKPNGGEKTTSSDFNLSLNTLGSPINIGLYLTL